MPPAWFPQTDIEFAMQDEIDTLCAEVKRLQDALVSGTEYDMSERHKLRNEIVALRERLAACHESYCSGEGAIASLRNEVRWLKACNVTLHDEAERDMKEQNALRAEVAKAQQYELDQRAEVERKAENMACLKTANDSLRAEVERLQAIVADAAFAPGNATLRKRNAELEEALQAIRARVAELEQELAEGCIDVELVRLRAEVERLETCCNGEADAHTATIAERDALRESNAALVDLIRRIEERWTYGIPLVEQELKVEMRAALGKKP